MQRPDPRRRVAIQDAEEAHNDREFDNPRYMVTLRFG